MKGGFGNSDYNDVREAERRYGAPPKTASSSTPYLTPKTNYPKVVEHVPSGDFKGSEDADLKDLQVGQKVEHHKFGFGEVVKMEGAAHNPVATVKFEQNGEKKIMLNYAKDKIRVIKS